MHGDIWTDVTVKRMNGSKNIIKTYHLDRFKEGNMLGGIFVVWIDPPHDKRPFERLLENLIEVSKEILECEDSIYIVKEKEDLEKAINENKLAIVMGLEGLSSIEKNIELIYPLYEFGFRHASLTWNEKNGLATGIDGDDFSGLTDEGRNLIRIMEQLNMIVDVSHANEKTFWDIMGCTEGPIIASHSNAKMICNHKRNLSDEQIKAIGDKNGLIGINSFNKFVHQDKDKQNIVTLADHIEHISSLIGIDHLAFGFDFFDYLDSESTSSFADKHTNAISDMKDITEVSRLIDELLKRGFTKENIDKISYKNFMEFFIKLRDE